MISERGVPITMRDGTVLRADVYRPDASGTFPVLVERLPYERLRAMPHAAFFVERGYVYVSQNVRGTFDSNGTFTLGSDDGWGHNRDGYDTVEWAAARPWSNGVVGMLGGSYSGYTAYAVVPTSPPHLRAMVVRQGSSDWYRDMFFRQGAHQLRTVREWLLRGLVLPQLDPDSVQAADVAKAVEEVDRWCSHLPLASFPPAIGHADWYFDHLAHPDDGAYWWARNTRRASAESAPPTLHVTSWFDIFLGGVIQQFDHMRAQSSHPQQLIIGPWIHGPNGIGVSHVGELDFGSQAQLDFNEQRCAWFDRWLKSAANGTGTTAPVRVFLMGHNRWLDLEDWPPPGARTTLLYLREGTGRDATSLNNGGLTFEAPTNSERPDSFVYDPEVPVPSLLTYPALGPRDHRPVEGRMLTYTTDPLERELVVLGPVHASLYALSSAPDTDWVVRLCDVWPDGRSMSVCDGILRARYRNSLQEPRVIGAARLACFDVDMVATGQVFQPGHRVRVEVTSSDFPRYDRNLNTGGPFAEEARSERAVNRVFHDVLRPSHVALSTLNLDGD